jgi:simple sugar transport system permease protein
MAIAVLAPLLPATLGGLATEYVGVLNIALEGLILFGGFIFVAVGSMAGPLVGGLAAMLATATLAWLADLFSRRAKADPFVVGLGLNLLVPGMVSIMSSLLFGTKGVVPVAVVASSRLLVHPPGSVLALVPLLGHRISDYLAYGLSALLALMLGTTAFGLRLRAVGSNPESVRMAGLDPGRLRGLAFALSGMACAVSGLALAAGIGAWVPQLSAGRGWIALVAVYLGGKRLGGTLLASAGFALLMALAGAGQALPGAQADLLMALPYLVTAMVVIAGAAMRKRRKS